MITWNNLDTVKAYEALKGAAKVNLAEVSVRFLCLIGTW